MRGSNTEQITALYCRLSQEDLRAGESLSIENQRLMLKDYADKNGFRNCQYYIDDGYSGVSSNRPDYQRMLSDVENGLIGTVIVKDQSRLSRNYLEAGRLMELVFPAYDVRFIAVTDGVDSANGINEISGIKNLFNDFYARDCSRKIRAVQRAKGERGERVGTTTPYGYMKDEPENMLIFENTHEALISRMLFDVVQKRYEGRKKSDKFGETDKFAGYLYCAECGSKLYLHRARTLDPDKNNYMCGGYQSCVTDCTSHYIREKALDAIVQRCLNSVVALARDHTEEFYRMSLENGEAEAQKQLREDEKVRNEYETKITQLDNAIQLLYMDRSNGKITDERYDTLSASFEKEQSEIKAKLAALESKVDKMKLREKCIRDFISRAKQFTKITKLTPEILRAFVKRIEVYEKEIKHSRTCGNRIVIYLTVAPDKPIMVDRTETESGEMLIKNI